MIAKLVGASIALVLLVTVGGTPAFAATTGLSAPQAGRIVSTAPSAETPAIMDGTVLSIAQVGNQIVIGGSFTTVRNPGSSTNIARSNLFAFDATTGQVSAGFAPNPSGAVYKVLPAADGASVYLGGDFFSLGYDGTPVSANRLTKVAVGDGAVDTAFAPGTWDGQVRDLELTGTRLWVAGKFTYVQGRPQKGLVSLNASTGLNDGFFAGVFAGTHTPAASAVTSVLSLSTTPDNKKLLVSGNFTSVDGQSRSQIAMFDISGTTYALANWYTKLFTSSCDDKFETYMTDLSFSPDGTWFAVSTTGAWGGTASNSAQSGCDLVARFETGSSGLDVRPTWTAYTGGDTTWTIEVTADTVYAGGHQKFQNNPGARDVAGPGAVERTGIAALNAVNGMAYSWNPTRTRGVGVKDMLATSTGLYVGSDTTVFANETRYRLAYLPLSGGTATPSYRALSLPDGLVTVASGSDQAVARRFDGTQQTAGPAPLSTGSVFDGAVGAFMLSGTVYTAYSDGSFLKRSWNGTTFGGASAVDTGDQLVRQDFWHDNDVAKMTSLFYSDGRIFYTLAGKDLLYTRTFEAENDTVGEVRTYEDSPGGLNYTYARGAFVADDTFYIASSTGALLKATWDGLRPVQGTVKQIAVPGSDWASRVMFGYQGSSKAAPTPAFTSSCARLTCTFDASSSVDLDGTVSSYGWDFGDGSTGSGAKVTHTYGSVGARDVSLSVSDDDGATGTTTQTVAPNDVSYVAASTSAGSRAAHTVTVPGSVRAGDQLVLFFTGNSSSYTYTGPAGWSQVEAKSANGAVGYAYKRTATSDDAGKTVTVTSSGYTKDTMTLAAYRSGTVADSAVSSDSAQSKHATPTVRASDAGPWLVSYWSDKGSNTTSWSVPSVVTKRSDVFGTGSGHTSGVLADSNGTVDAGSVGGLTATADNPSTAGISFSVLVG